MIVSLRAVESKVRSACPTELTLEMMTMWPEGKVPSGLRLVAVFVLNLKTVPPSKVKVLVPPPDATVTNLPGPSLNVRLEPS